MQGRRKRKSSAVSAPTCREFGRGAAVFAGARGVPNILGINPEVFIGALKDYRDGVRANPVMASVARSLTEDEMAALAAYFHSAKPKGRR